MRNYLSSWIMTGAHGIAALILAVLCAGCAASGRVYSPPLDQDAAFAKGADRPPSAKTLYRLAKVLAAQGKVAQSSASLRACIDRYPGFLPAYSQLADLYLRYREFDAATEILERGLDLAPDDPVLRNNLGMCLLLTGRCEEARVEFSRSAAASPHDARSRANLALATGMLGRYNECLALYRQVVSNADAHYNLGVICEATGDTTRAEIEFARAAKSSTLVPAELGPNGQRTARDGLGIAQVPRHRHREGSTLTDPRQPAAPHP